MEKSSSKPGWGQSLKSPMVATRGRSPKGSDDVHCFDSRNCETLGKKIGIKKLM
jgi:hypothetical protein